MARRTEEEKEALKKEKEEALKKKEGVEEKNVETECKSFYTCEIAKAEDLQKQGFVVVAIKNVGGMMTYSFEESSKLKKEVAE